MKSCNSLHAVSGMRSLLFVVVTAWLLIGCSSSDDEAWPPEDETTPQAEELAPAEPDEMAEDEDSPLAEYPADDVEAVREFTDDMLTDLMETSIACDLLSSEQLGDVVGGDWADGIFRWFESEVNLAPGALRGICVWQDLEHRTNISLRVYDDSDIAWEAIRDYYSGLADRIHERPLGEGPEIGSESYRKPHGEQGYDGTCTRLDEHIVCLNAPPRHADEWVELDKELLEIVAEAL